MFEKLLGFCEQARLEAAIFPILTPYPGARVRERLELEKRITCHDWGNCDMGHVNLVPGSPTTNPPPSPRLRRAGSPARAGGA